MARAVGLTELFVRLGRVTVAESMIDEAFDYVSERQWRERHLDDPHGAPWFTSMHVSSFPGGDPRPCPRKLAYELMAFAHTEQMPQKAIAAGVVGSAAEDWVVNMLDLDGRLLSARADAAHQIGFEDADHWLTGSPDIVCLPKFWNRPLVIEAKSLYVDQMQEMRQLKRPCAPAHARQCQGYVGLGHHLSPLLWPRVVVCRHTWRLAEDGIEPVIDSMICRDHGVHADTGCLVEIELQPIKDGVVLYAARDHLEQRKSWYFEHDEQRFQRGLDVLRQVQSHYANDEIPPHPFGGKQWSAEPCKYCVDPGSLILCADLTWRLAGHLKEGDRLIGFDEHSNGRNRSRYRPSVVESHEVISRPRLMIKTNIGYTIVSTDHEFLVQPTRSRRRQRRFVRADELQTGDMIVAFGRPWLTANTFDAGWLAGLFDGEGSVARGHVSVAQCPGAVLEQAKTILSSYGFDWREHAQVNGNGGAGRPCSRLHVSRLYEQLRLLGTIRPVRLLENSEVLWSDAATWSKTTSNVEVLEIVDQGPGEVVAMSTSTRTFISDGLLSHNCDLKRNVCKPDHQAGVAKLTESHGVDWSKGVYGEHAYDPIKIRQAVLERWRGRSGFNYTLPEGYTMGRNGVQRERERA